ncbi:aminotransferase class III-fold pyridoxal phosphate-dependent enzyme [Nostoc sp. UHCC 0251]|uniref:aminotransferase class III-fold pyridoxal phosphate-dependent enzyme n=1 Tax=Nostoc sp. UHCC 0251 TaxID=3110240 RepID=UPI002B1FB30D|nr:aminotransferase class III-fold pyridoxal phosphate-dependent enzyme [Nostoc sp. UHCC 0251]MEA5622677.1 aminotransferase class III-fold pyridoxal phosphate-dependent enzyme [Nostoc sp. UHCC 0251]
MEPIAIIGIGCRFPQANNPESFWKLLHNGIDAIAQVPKDRWDVEAFYDPDPATPGKMNTRWGGFLDRVDRFDPNFFGISPREAERIDPQHRLVLEVAWEALEDSAIAPESLAGSQTGVFIGIGNYDYGRFLCRDLANINIHNGTGLTLSIAANRLSYLLDLHGPSMAIETACSSSLVAIHSACQSLRSGESNLAITGGVSLMLSPDMTITFSQARMMAPDGRCKTFDASANGYVRGEGCGITILKRLSDAIQDQDRILAVIKGSAVNHDGLSNGITAPNGLAQQAVIRQALKNAGVAPAEISYIEAHGTGTPLGDPIEIRALKAVLMSGRSPEQRCGIGSVKTNIGHLEPAAGVAGLIKVVLSLQHKEIPPHLHLQELNPRLGLDGTPFFIPGECQPWPSDRLLAGVSGFSFGGTNSHLILEAAPGGSRGAGEQGSRGAGGIFQVERSLHLLTLSAKNEAALQELAQRYADFLAADANVSLADVCFSANTGRSHFAHRLAIVAQSSKQLGDRLSNLTENKAMTGILAGKVASRQSLKIAFLFTGQGSQYVGMGRQLYETQPSFRKTLERCDRILRPYLDKPLLELLYATDAESSLLDETAYTQPALFALEYAIAELWQSWGVIPHVVIGHSLGEYVAACVAGVFSLEEGLKLVAKRASLMQSLPQTGEMVAVFASENQVQAAIQPYSSEVAIAAINGLESIVISGQRSPVRALVAAWSAQGIKTQQLRVSHAFHSPLIAPMLDTFETEASQVKFQTPRLPLISNLTGEMLPSEYIPDANYWRRHTREPVKFMAGINSLFAQGYNLFLEIGSKPILSKMGQKCQQSHAIWLPSLAPGQEDWQVLLSSLSALYVQGVDINWRGFDRDYSRNKRSLPTYPFQRQRYWIQDTTQVMDEQKLDAKVSQFQTDAISDTKPPQQILVTLGSIISKLLQLAPDKVDIYTPFLEMGADSLILIDAIAAIENTYNIKISISQLFEEYRTIEALATYIAQNVPSPESKSQPTQSPQIANTVIPNSPETLSESALERIMSQQLQVMSQLMSQQLELLQGKGSNQAQVSSSSNGDSLSPQQATAPTVNSYQNGKPNQQLVSETQIRELNPQQQRHLQALIARYTKRTQQSKQRAEISRSLLADSRAVAGFRPSIKEMVYPIIGERAKGAKFWDIDGNEYIDISMGFGVLLFGHDAPFVTQALTEQIHQGIQLGPQSNLATEVARLICELTNMERVTFCNTGTEAVMTALRLARTTTGQNKIALFTGSYHGHFDGVLARAVPGETNTVPMTVGISRYAVADVLVLDYGNPQSLDILRTHAGELAAVLVEPVQSRHPHLQPQGFLQQLRQLTQAEGIALIFDEVITGFRIHPGGFQAYSGIEADLVIYGKIIGGGLPMGVVAGKRDYMNGIDGGIWNYGDASYPQAQKTFFAGTFNKNHLGMAAARAVLQHLQQEGFALQQQLNHNTSELAATLNAYFQAENVPIELVHFGSLFRFASSENIDLLFYHLLEKGIYIWEGRNCFLSTAHTNADIDEIIQAVKDSIKELRQGGFFPKGGSKSPANELSVTSSKKVPLHLPSPREISDRLTPQFQQLIVQEDLEAYQKGLIKLEALSLTYILKAFQEMGWEFHPGKEFTLVAIAQQLGVVNQHQRLLGRLLEILAEEGILRPVNDLWEVMRVPEIQHFQVREILSKYPILETELSLIQRCGQELAQVLQGKRHPLELLFPNGDSTSLTKLYQDSPVARIMNALVQKTIAIALENLPKGSNVGILEIGAGTGGTTAHILPHLPDRQTKYLFTDLSPLFLAKARQKFGDYPFVSFEILDIEQELEAQGFGSHQYDIIVAANVLHATADLHNSLKQVLQLLVPGGLLVLMEGTTRQRWLDLIFGLTQGWWKFGDSNLRPSYPLLDASQWQTLLEEGGFREVVTIPAAASQMFASLPQQSVIVAEAAQKIPLTEAQKQLWVLAQMSEEGSIAYNESVSLQLQGSLDLEAMYQAVQKVVNRHEALRTIISTQSNCQQILPSMKIDIPTIDFSNWDSSTCKVQVAKWLQKEGRKPFDLSVGPLLRVHILKLESQLHLLVLTVHHIIIDGWSIDVIFKDLGAIYSAECQNIPDKLEEPMQFRQYINWQEQQSQTEKMLADKSYWLGQFADSIPVLELPTDYPRPPIQTYAGVEQTMLVDAECLRELKSFSNQHGCTFFMTLIAVLNLLLHHLSGQDDIVIGVPTAGQSCVGDKDLVGYCANVLPLCFVVKNQSFSDYLNTIKKVFLHGYDHQNYPMSQLLKELNIKRDPSRPPLITTLVGMDKFGVELKFWGLKVEGLTNYLGIARRELTWNMVEIDGKLSLKCNYNTDIYSASTIRHWMQQLETIFRTVIKQPDISLDAIAEKLTQADGQKQIGEEQKLAAASMQKLKNFKRNAI